jgi:hypothetical protein
MPLGGAGFLRGLVNAVKPGGAVDAAKSLSGRRKRVSAPPKLGSFPAAASAASRKVPAGSVVGTVKKIKQTLSPAAKRRMRKLRKKKLG